MTSFALDAATIRAEWTRSQVDDAAAQELWAVFSRQQQSPEQVGEDDFSLAIVLANSMVNPDSTVFDLGCGSGLYTSWFARHCSHVVAADLSPEMLALANDRLTEEGVRSKVDLTQVNWHTCTSQQAPWHRAFDLSFANMTPAIQSAETFDAFRKTSRNWCYMSKPTRRNEPTTKELLKRLGKKDTHRPFETDMLLAFCLLYAEGLNPHVDYRKVHWKKRQSISEAAEYYSAWLATNYGIDSEQRLRVKPIIEELAQDGFLDDQDDVTITSIWWQERQ